MAYILIINFLHITLYNFSSFHIGANQGKLFNEYLFFYVEQCSDVWRFYGISFQCYLNSRRVPYAVLAIAWKEFLWDFYLLMFYLFCCLLFFATAATFCYSCYSYGLLFPVIDVIFPVNLISPFFLSRCYYQISQFDDVQLFK